MTFDMAYVVGINSANPFFDPSNALKMYQDTMATANSLKKFFEFEAPTDITWAWELEPDMIYPERDC